MTGTEKGVTFLLVSNIIFFSLTYIISIYLARFGLSQAEFGQYNVVISFVLIFSTILVTATQQVSAKLIAEKGKRIAHKFFVYIFLTNLLFVAVLFLLSGQVALILNDISLTPYIQIASIIIATSSIYALVLGEFNGLKKYKHQSIITIIHQSAKLSGIILFVGFGLKVYGAILGYIFSAVISSAAGLWMARKKVESFEPNLKLFYQMVMVISVSLLFNNILISMDLLMLKALSPNSISSSLAGVYSASGTLSRMMLIFATTFATILIPIIANKKEQQGKTFFYLKNSSRYLLLVTAPILAVLLLDPKTVITLFYSQSYASGWTALAILSTGIFFYGFFQLFSSAFIALGKEKILMGISISMLALSFILNLTLIPLLSIEGAALSTAISILLGTILAWAILSKERNFTFNIANLKIIICCAIASIFLIIIPLNSWFALIKYGIFLGIYLILLILFKATTKVDFLVIKKLLEKKSN
ncbi:MAG: flippase [archaeon]|jgi:stage V sporulation protein B